MQSRSKLSVLGITLASVCLLTFSACSKTDEPYRKPLTKVTGTILVDGKPPESPVQINFHFLGAPDTEHPSLSSSITKPDGTFAASTYETGDGVPEGEYAITCILKTYNMIARTYQGPDLLKGKYSNLKKPAKTFKAEANAPVELGTIELTTK